MGTHKISSTSVTAVFTLFLGVGLWVAVPAAGGGREAAVTVVQAENERTKPDRSESEIKKQMTKIMDQVFMVLNTIMAAEGLTDTEKRERALEFLRTFRYGEKGEGYIVVMSLAGVIQVEPNILELVGKDVHSLEDPNGIKVFEEFTRICLEQGQGWATYVWPKPGNKQWHVPTVSLVRYFEPLGAAVVTSYNPVTIEVEDMGAPIIDDQDTASPT